MFELERVFDVGLEKSVHLGVEEGLRDDFIKNDFLNTTLDLLRTFT